MKVELGSDELISLIFYLLGVRDGLGDYRNNLIGDLVGMAWLAPLFIFLFRFLIIWSTEISIRSESFRLFF